MQKKLYNSEKNLFAEAISAIWTFTAEISKITQIFHKTSVK